MSRAILYLLLLANAGVLLWQLTPGGAPQSALPEPDPNARQLLLLSERDAPRQAATGRVTMSTTTVTPSSAKSPDAPAPEGRCYTLGPFRSQDTAALARAALEDLNLEPGERVRNEREQYGYQVYIPPFDDRDAAIEAARALADKGITEYYIMNEERLRNAVSLGLFRNKQHADRQLAELRKKDIFAEVLPRYRDRKLYWLDYADPRQLLTAMAVRQLFPDDPVQRLSRNCS